MSDDINVKFSADIADIQAKLASVSAEFQKATNGMASGAQKTATTTEASFAKIETAINGVKAAVAPLLAVFAPIMAALGASQVINTASEFEQLEIRLKAVMGSAAAGENAFKWIKQFAVDTPYSVQQTTDAFMQLKNFGLDPMDGTLQKVSDASAKYGKSADTAQRVTLALGQAWARGKLQGQDTLQMIDAGIPVYDLLSKATGKTTAEIQQMSEKGTMGRDVMRQLIDQMGQEGAGAAADKMKSYAGAVSNMGDAFANAIDKLRKQGGFDFLTQGILKFTEAIPSMVDVFGQACAAVGDAVSALFGVISTVFDGIGAAINTVFGLEGSGMTGMQKFIFAMKSVQAGIVALQGVFSQVCSGITTILASLVGVVLAAGDTIQAFFNAPLGSKADAGAAAWRKGLANVAAVIREGTKDIISAGVESQKKIDDIFDNRSGGDTRVKGTKVDLSKDKSGSGKTNKPESAIPLMDEELTIKKIAMLKTQGREMDKAEEMAFWREKQSLATTSAADKLAIQKKLLADELAIEREGNQALLAEVRAAAAEYKAIDSEKRAFAEKTALDGVAAKEAEIQHLKAIGQIDALEEIALLRKTEEEKKSIRLKYANERRDMEAVGTAAYQRAENEAIGVVTEANAKIKELDNKAVAEKRAQWDAMMKPVTDAMDKSVNGVIAGTTTIKKAFADLAQSIVLEITNKIIKQGINKMMDALFAQQSAGGASGGGGIGGGIMSIIGSMMGGGGGIPSFAVGAWNLPGDTLAMVHKGETIIPAAQAEKFRSGQFGGAMNVSNQFIMSGAPDRATQDQIAVMAAASMNNAMRRNN